MSRTSLGKLPDENELAKREAERQAKQQEHADKMLKRKKEARRKLENKRAKNRFTHIYSVSLNRLNQSQENMRRVEQLCESNWNRAYTVVNDTLCALFRDEENAKTFYINAARQGFRPNFPIRLRVNRYDVGIIKQHPKTKGHKGTWKAQRPNWVKKGVIINGKKFSESQASRMSRVTNKQGRNS